MVDREEPDINIQTTTITMVFFIFMIQMIDLAVCKHETEKNLVSTFLVSQSTQNI